MTHWTMENRLVLCYLRFEKTVCPVVVRRTSQRIEFLSTGRDTGVKAIDEDQEVKNDSKNYKLI